MDCSKGHWQVAERKIQFYFGGATLDTRLTWHAVFLQQGEFFSEQSMPAHGKSLLLSF